MIYILIPGITIARYYFIRFIATLHMSQLPDGTIFYINTLFMTRCFNIYNN